MSVERARMRAPFDGAEHEAAVERGSRRGRRNRRARMWTS
jgi:hypothetical protein